MLSRQAISLYLVDFKVGQTFVERPQFSRTTAGNKAGSSAEPTLAPTAKRSNMSAKPAYGRATKLPGATLQVMVASEIAARGI